MAKRYLERTYQIIDYSYKNYEEELRQIPNIYNNYDIQEELRKQQYEHQKYMIIKESLREQVENNAYKSLNPGEMESHELNHSLNKSKFSKQSRVQQDFSDVVKLDLNYSDSFRNKINNGPPLSGFNKQALITKGMGERSLISNRVSNEYSKLVIDFIISN